MSADEIPDAARAALERARVSARGNPAQPRRSGPLRRRSAAGQYSSARPDDRDPQSIGGVWAAAVKAEGWDRALDAAKVRTLWPEIVGPANAENTTVEQFDPATGLLTVRAHSTAWAQQLRMMLPLLLSRVDAEIGAGVVVGITVAGPVAPSWVKGRLRVKGRGPRDTYG
ncbi:MAG: DUF721 domain-containing protein [Candidatus Nanopelagicales bacterium]